MSEWVDPGRRWRWRRKISGHPVLEAQAWAGPAGVWVHHAVGSGPEGADSLRDDAPLVL